MLTLFGTQPAVFAKESIPEMRLEKDTLSLTRQEAMLVANRLKGIAPAGFVPEDPDWPTDPETAERGPDLYACTAACLENGDTIEIGVKMSARKKAEVRAEVEAAAQPEAQAVKEQAPPPPSVKRAGDATDHPPSDLATEPERAPKARKVEPSGADPAQTNPGSFKPKQAKEARK